MPLFLSPQISNPFDRILLSGVPECKLWGDDMCISKYTNHKGYRDILSQHTKSLMQLCSNVSKRDCHLDSVEYDLDDRKIYLHVFADYYRYVAPRGQHKDGTDFMSDLYKSRYEFEFNRIDGVELLVHFRISSQKTSYHNTTLYHVDHEILMPKY